VLDAWCPSPRSVEALARLRRAPVVVHGRIGGIGRSVVRTVASQLDGVDGRIDGTPLWIAYVPEVFRAGSRTFPSSAFGVLTLTVHQRGVGAACGRKPELGKVVLPPTDRADVVGPGLLTEDDVTAARTREIWIFHTAKMSPAGSTHHGSGDA